MDLPHKDNRLTLERVLIKLCIYKIRQLKLTEKIFLGNEQAELLLSKSLFRENLLVQKMAERPNLSMPEKIYAGYYQVLESRLLEQMEKIRYDTGKELREYAIRQHLSSGG